MAVSDAPLNEVIDAAAAWYAMQDRNALPRPILPLIKDRFGLDNKAAIAVLRRVNTVGVAHDRAS